VNGHSVEVDGRRISGKNVLIATGARTAVSPIDGLDTIEYLTNESAYELEERPEHLLVLGGGYIALENAQAFARLGSKVTVLELLPRILATEAEDVTETLQEFLRADGVDIHTGVRATSVRCQGTEVIVETSINGQSRVFRGSHLFVATGRRGNTEDLGLEALGIGTTRGGYLQVDDSLRTSVPTVFGAGDVIGRWQFVYTAAYEGQLAAENALRGYHLHRSYAALPWVVFTDPQVAGVGIDERQAQEAGIAYEVSTLPLDQVPRALAARDTRGFIKLLREVDTDRLIGARVVAAEGSELLMEVALAIKYDLTVREIKGLFHPYLTLSEGIKLAALAFDKDVKKLSCCAA
ncbi:MAG: FAD-dependent oxidoreductase, partial [Rhodothermales bacterium]